MGTISDETLLFRSKADKNREKYSESVNFRYKNINIAQPRAAVLHLHPITSIFPGFRRVTVPRRVLLAVCTLVLSAVFGFGQQVTSPDFTFILFPDTQNEAQCFPQVMPRQTKWVADVRTHL